MKKIIILAAVLIVVAFLLKSCFTTKSLCGSNEHDVLRTGCEKALQKN
ncbi:hypothetical protein OGW13_09220 [Citrobacter sp. Ca225]|nr:hypothetical protein [Citrobacter sp. Ca225]MDM3520117.1 hypothetical protein [Citrobacter sp. Ca225]